MDIIKVRPIDGLSDDGLARFSVSRNGQGIGVIEEMRTYYLYLPNKADRCLKSRDLSELTREIYLLAK